MQFCEKQDVVCVLENFTIRGRVRLQPQEVGAASAERGFLDRDEPCVELENATVMDHEGRIIKKVGRLGLNSRHVLYWMEDDRAQLMSRLKSLLDQQDYESAASELSSIVKTQDGDGDLYYLAGIAFGEMGAKGQAVSYFNKALSLTLDGRLRAVIEGHLEALES